MSEKRASVRIHESEEENRKPLMEKPLVEVSEIVEARENGEDLYLVMGNRRYQFTSSISPIYQVKEYVVEVNLIKDSMIRFAHKDGRHVPVNREPNCGYTLVGKAQEAFEAYRALTAKGESVDDQTYVYINERSILRYIGESGVHKLFLRIYDSPESGKEDRWVVLYMD